MTKYRIFVQDVGKSGFSGFTDVDAYSVRHALETCKVHDLRKYIALPHSRRDLWPDGKTAQLPEGALRFGKGYEDGQ